MVFAITIISDRHAAVLSGWRHVATAGVFASLCLLAGCAGSGSSFSERPGFSAWFAANPPNPLAATAHERLLLERYRPRLWVSADAEGPISFYSDYISSGYLVDGSGNRIDQPIDAVVLNRFITDTDAVFTHEPDSNGQVRAEALGRVDYARLEGFGQLTFLTWHFVFRHSGLPATLGRVRGALLDAVADTDDWHQLDHYTATTLVLGPTSQPIALMLQQHNYRRSYVLGCDVDLGQDGRPRVTAAKRSNELYPWQAEATRHRAVPFMNESGLAWLMQGENQPLMSADDFAEPGREVDYRLAWLPGTDAFYQFRGSLGASRRLPGRSGPPGADFDTLPAGKDLITKLTVFNWPQDDVDYMQKLIEFISNAWKGSGVDADALQWFQKRFIERLRQRCALSG